MAYLYLSIAIVAEVIATSALKVSNQLTVLVPSILSFAGYGVAFYFLALALKWIPVGVAYAVWAGVGIALITIVGAVLFKQMLDTPAIVGIALIIAGVAVLNLYSNKSVQ
ncbi:MAG: multidrug efflux SMR transporter [Woeseiaceae bacterium]|nr:multidrug efflux SMR transporter [Woeseiaceae bacterium]